MDYSRQTEILKPHEFKAPVHVIGSGATGSWVTMLLVQLGIPNIHVWDYDNVEEHNLPNQAFLHGHIGKPKVEAIADLAALLTDTPNRITVHNEKVTGATRMSGVVFVLTDTMSSRIDIFKKALKMNPLIKRVIETRMDAMVGMVYSLNPNSRDEVRAYEETLYTDEAATTSICGIAQSLAPTAAAIASQAVWQLIKWHQHQVKPDDATATLSNHMVFDLMHDYYECSSYN